MEKKNKSLKFLMILYISICLMAGISQNSTIMTSNSEDADNQLDYIEETVNLRSNALDPIIHINNNWTEAIGAGIATGTGSWSDPLVIQDKIIDAGQANYGLYIQNSNGSYYRIENCTIYNANIAGILLTNADNGTVINCNISFNSDAEPLDNQGIGIWVSGATNSTFINNNLCNNSEYGLYITSGNNTFENNFIFNNTRDGIRLPGGGASDCIFSNNRIEDNGYFGWASWGGTNNQLIDNIIEGNGNNGIHFYGPDGNIVKGNLIKDNGDAGINFENNAVANYVYKNAFINNIIHSESKDGNGNFFNTASIGNYWDNYTGNDDNGDGIGDTAYDWIVGTTDKDELPIHDNPFHTGETIHIDDAGAKTLNWSQTALVKNWISGSGAYGDPYIIENLKIDCIGTGNGIFIEDSLFGVYFTIRNCHLTNSGYLSRNGGIYVFNSSNGMIINNNCSYNNENGISLYEAFNHTILNNTAIHNTEAGIAIEGEDIYKCENISILDNIVDDNKNGIRLERSNNLTVSNNSAFNCSYDGIYCWFVDNSDFNGNNANNCSNDGIFMNICINNTIIQNYANNNSRHGIYAYQNYGKHIIRNNTVWDNSFYGIGLDGSGSGTCDDNNVSENLIYRNKGLAGIYINSADNNLVYNNLIEENTQRGIYISGTSYDNIIYNNTFIGNGLHAQEVSSGMNYWNSSTIGNYWDNYTGSDNNGDGFGDDPYIISASPLRQDEMPIWEKTENITIDGTATGVDAHNWTWAVSQSWCTGLGTYADPYIISDLYLNVGGTGDCLKIENSNAYFIVRNSVFKKAGTTLTDSAIKLFNVENGIIEENTCEYNRRAIILSLSHNNTILKNNISSNTEYGIYGIDSNDNIVKRNRIEKCLTGIFLINCDDNIFTLNEIFNNTNFGLYITNVECSDNYVYKNAFLDNNFHARDSSGATPNYWNNSVIGNYWDNHSTGDGNNNGIDDTAYNGITGTAGAVDNFPIFGDPRHDGLSISIDDSVVGNGWQFHSTRFWCSGSGTWNDPYILEDLSVEGLGNTGIEIQFCQLRYFIIRNCYITNTGSDGGIYLYESRNGTIANNYILGSIEKGIRLESSQNISISYNHVYAVSTGIYVFNSNNNTITGNSVYNNSNNGIYLINSDSCDLDDNTVIYNGDSGIKLSNCDFTDLTGNTLSFNNESGLEMIDCLLTDVINNGNSFNNNTFAGIDLINSNSSTISGNTANNNNVGIVLNFSHNNIISGNTFLGNTYWRNVTANSTGNVFSNNNYGQIIPSDNPPGDTPPPDQPMDIMIIIIIGVIIGAVAVVGGVVAKGKSSKEGKKTGQRKETKPKAEVQQKLQVKVKQKGMTPPPPSPKGPKKGKKDKIEFEDKPKELSPEEKAELQKTEAEVGVEKQKFFCVVHKGPIDADNIYLCPGCQTFYCTNCAKVLKEKGEKCWSCDAEIQVKTETPPVATPVDEPDMVQKALELEAQINKFEVYIQQAQAMVQKLDIKFGAGEISTEEYMEKKNLLAEKMGEAMAKRDQLKEQQS